ncbi:MAG: hypothetical protein ACF8AM_14815 [Rhodopirellula sp. JB055]|uniref:hypothetical protein n=1 Tax=Rhodopirellula sp. JB055 TaxID=3342846 RepID=UPI00370BDF7C
MNFQRVSFLIATALLLAAFCSSDVVAQCRSGGGRSPSGSPASYASNSMYPQNALVSNRYSQGNLAALQYQQQQFATQRQVANVAYENVQRQRLAAMQFDTEVHLQRLARAEAKRAARAERIAARLREHGRLDESYTLASVQVGEDTPRR